MCKFTCITGGRRAGKSYAIAQILKQYPKKWILIPNLRVMDGFISLGVQPSQLKMPSECKKPPLNITVSIDGEDIGNGGNQ